MKILKVGKKIIINDITKIESEMSYNNSMIQLVGKDAKIIDVSINVYNNKPYYKLDVDMGKNVWAEEWIASK